MRIKFITVCPRCFTAKQNTFSGLGESHAKWIVDQTEGIKWTCHTCGFEGKMPVRDVDKQS